MREHLSSKLEVLNTTWEAKNLDKAVELLLDKLSPTDVLQLLTEQTTRVGGMK